MKERINYASPDAAPDPTTLTDEELKKRILSWMGGPSIGASTYPVPARDRSSESLHSAGRSAEAPDDGFDPMVHPFE